MNFKQLSIILGGIVLILVAGLFFVLSKNDVQTNNLGQQNLAEDSFADNNANTIKPLSKDTQTKEVSPSLVWKDVVYNQFKNLTTWKVDENLADWKLISLDRSQLDKYNKGKIFELSKTFNESAEPDYDGQKSLEQSVKKVLIENGWKFVAGPTEGSAYNDYLYVKDGHPLVLKSGTRDAVKGGMYVIVEFQY